MIKHTHTCAHTHKHTHARTRTLAQVASLGLSDPIFFCAASAHRSGRAHCAHSRTRPHAAGAPLGCKGAKARPPMGLCDDADRFPSGAAAARRLVSPPDRSRANGSRSKRAPLRSLAVGWETPRPQRLAGT
jgi:hypothetical protein